MLLFRKYSSLRRSLPNEGIDSQHHMRGTAGYQKREHLPVEGSVAVSVRAASTRELGDKMYSMFKLLSKIRMVHRSPRDRQGHSARPPVCVPVGVFFLDR